jgi:hypothetical protein
MKLIELRFIIRCRDGFGGVYWMNDDFIGILNQIFRSKSIIEFPCPNSISDDRSGSDSVH